MLRAALTLIVLLTPQLLVAQQVMQIVGPDKPVGFTQIAELTTNVDIVIDDQGRPSHTVEWELPRGMLSRTRVYQDGRILVFATGCKAEDVIVGVRVTDWVNRRIARDEYTLRIRGDSEDPGPVDPGPGDPGPVDPPGNVKDSPLYSVAKRAFAGVQDPDKERWGNQMSASFGYIAGEVKDKKFTSIEEMLERMRAAVRGELDIPGVDPFPDEVRKNWTGFREAVAIAFDALETDGKLKTVDDYWLHFRALEVALDEITKGN